MGGLVTVREGYQPQRPAGHTGSLRAADLKPPRAARATSTLRDIVRERIARSGSSQSQAARDAGITPQHLSDFLLGRRGMRSDTLDRLLAACPTRRRST